MKIELITQVLSKYQAFKTFKESGNTRAAQDIKYVYPPELYVSQVALAVFKALQSRRDK